MRAHSFNGGHVHLSHSQCKPREPGQIYQCRSPQDQQNPSVHPENDGQGNGQGNKQHHPENHASTACFSCTATYPSWQFEHGEIKGLEQNLPRLVKRKRQPQISNRH
ncbi:hypothetical protein BRADI_4g10651v3 [Brachypodium distachyon]|uniref:Uncharacterized protein n=1 Tax=Brachypodium distachyon TaxID=15368 RepID=A0A2K2CLZ2_BRADI|nr:hypothetical protein BRADI_4g10651v3 [Brachypodium distachyon]PNT63040.1 hypothetical protein BRADI_4g10651v3 [Brachypodium distachyon]